MIYCKWSGDYCPSMSPRPATPEPKPVTDDDVLDDDALIRLGVKN